MSKRINVAQVSDSQAFMEWIREQPCVSCGFNGTLHDDGRLLNDPSHVKSRGSGGGDIGNVVPQCRACHVELHMIGKVRFIEKYGIDLLSLAKHYGRKYADGICSETTGTPTSES